LKKKATAGVYPVEEKSLEGNPLVHYKLILPGEQRTLQIVFEKDFPYRIQSGRSPTPVWPARKP
jgi:hypothetical protein